MTAIQGAGRARLGPMLGGWGVFITVETITQIVMKYAGEGLNDYHGLGPMIAHAAASPVTWLAFALYFAGFLVWLTILKDVDMGRAFPMTATIYLATLTAAVLLFHERLNLMRILGVVAIVAGVGLLATDANTSQTHDAPEPSGGG